MGWWVGGLITPPATAYGLKAPAELAESECITEETPADGASATAPGLKAPAELAESECIT